MKLPNLTEPLTGSSVVPWRYHFNTVTFSYTTAFWSWDDWETQLDWMALHGINLPLAWVGQEKLLIDTFREAGFNDTEISDLLSGPAFQAWNRFGNIQGDWSGTLPKSWIQGQFQLQKKIVARMVELGMTPVLPAFTGFVPRSISRVYPNASVLIGSQWSNFPVQYTNVTFLNPSESLDLFTTLQKSFISKQQEAYGNITSVYTLDQYNENNPSSGDVDFLGNLTENTWRSLKAADPSAIWMMQAWLFHSNSAFWTNERIEGFLRGVPNSDMLILDLFSESSPQWQRTNSYYGKPWIWCQLHDYGGNLGLYGQVMNLTIDPIQALANSSSLVGFGLSMEAQEGNQIVYDLLLDQAWSETPIDTDAYFHDWVSSRYNSGAANNNSSSSSSVPPQLYRAWDRMRTTVYNNTNVTVIPSVQKSILELAPARTGLVNRTDRHGTTITYDPAVLVDAWNMFYQAAQAAPNLWDNPAYAYDMVDVTRQVLSNAFNAAYLDVMVIYNGTTTSNSSSSSNSTRSASSLTTSGTTLLDLLSSLDGVLATNEHFRVSTWLSSALAWANSTTLAAYYEYNARNQITLWGPTGQISDYASKTWSGLVSSYYRPRWAMFLDYLAATPPDGYNATALAADLLVFAEQWQLQTWGHSANETFTGPADGGGGSLDAVLSQLKSDWPSIFGSAS